MRHNAAVPTHVLTRGVYSSSLDDVTLQAIDLLAQQLAHVFN
jgi:hypothetical protein